MLGAVQGERPPAQEPENEAQRHTEAREQRCTLRQEREEQRRSDSGSEQEPLARLRDPAAAEQGRHREPEPDEPAHERDPPEPGARLGHRPLAQAAVDACERPEALADDRHAVWSRHAAEARERLHAVDSGKDGVHP